MANGDELLRLFGGIGEAAQAANPYTPMQEAAGAVQNNLYGLAAKQKDGKMGEAIAAGLLTGLMGGAAQGMGNRFVGNQEALALQAMKDMQGGNVIAPNGMTRSVFNRLNAGAAVKQLAETERVKQETQELQSGLNKAVLNQLVQQDPSQLTKAAASLGLEVPGGKMRGQNASPVLVAQAAQILDVPVETLQGMSEGQLKQAVSNALDLNRITKPSERELDPSRYEVEARARNVITGRNGSPNSVDEHQRSIQDSYEILMKEVGINSNPASDIPFIETVQRIENPGVSVRQGTIDAYMKEGSSTIQKILGQAGAIDGRTGRLTNETRRQLARAAIDRVASQQDSFNRLVQNQKDLVKIYGGNPDNILTNARIVDPSYYTKKFQAVIAPSRPGYRKGIKPDGTLVYVPIEGAVTDGE